MTCMISRALVGEGPLIDGGRRTWDIQIGRERGAGCGACYRTFFPWHLCLFADHVVPSLHGRSSLLVRFALRVLRVPLTPHTGTPRFACVALPVYMCALRWGRPTPLPPWQAGGLRDWSGSYAPPLAFWAALAAAGALVAHWLAGLHVPALSAPDDVNLVPSQAGGTR